MITWEDKVKMIKMFNQDSSWNDIREFVKSNINEFDPQAIDMFITSVNLSKVKEDVYFFKIVSERIKEFESRGFQFSLRTKTRIHYMNNEILKSLDNGSN